MSKTELILEALFTGADEEEIARRDAMAPKIIQDEWVEDFLFLKRKDIKKNSDGSYDVDGDVNLVNLKLVKLPLKFNHVSGYFWCDNNHLTSLEGAPETVGGSFWCHNNQFTTLEGAPKTVGGGFWCHNNQFTTLEGAPKTVGGNFWCDNNQKKFTEAEVRAVSDVKGYIYV